MVNKLIDYFLKITPLTSDEQESLVASMLVKSFKSGDFILKEGQRSADTFFVLEGLARQYKLIGGEEITTAFYKEGQWIISLLSFTENPVCQENLICIEDTTIVVGNEQKAQELFSLYPRFETISRVVMETVFYEQQQRLNAYLTDSPEKRYLALLETQPDILQRVPQYQIASYIGIKPESLSRIRKRISNKSS